MDYKDKKVLIAGFSVAPGSESIALYNYLKTVGPADITALHWGGEEVAKQMPDDIEKISIDSPKDITPEQVTGYDVVFRHTSVHPELLAGVKVYTVTQEFFDKCPAKIIGVTGTKGKGTTSTLIAKILEAAGKTVHLVGNIGVPSLEVLPDIAEGDVVVHELSSFQLWDLAVSPRVAVILMVEPDHMDVHKDMNEYVEAKANIAKWQTVNDFLFYHPTNKLSAKIAEYGTASKEPYMSSSNAYVEDGKIYLKGEEICSTDEVGLLGKHNLENICAALAAASCFTNDTAAMRKALIEFKGLENRLEFVRDVDEVAYYNDTFSAAPMATRAAVEAFDQPVVLILGGFDRQIDFAELAKVIAQRDLKKVLLVGEIKHKLAETLDSVNFSNYEIVEGGMAEIVSRAYIVAKSGDVVLLSPGAPSFDMFKDFKDRGAQFKAAVESL